MEDASPLVDTSESCPETIIDATAPDCDEPELEAAGKRAGWITPSDRSNRVRAQQPPVELAAGCQEVTIYSSAYPLETAIAASQGRLPHHTCIGRLLYTPYGVTGVYLSVIWYPVTGCDSIVLKKK